MTEIEQVEAFAELYGWKKVPDDYYIDRIAFANGKERIASVDLPDSNDLNVVHKAIKLFIKLDKRSEFVERLTSITQEGRMATVGWTLATAEVGQLRKALLQTLGKWKQ